MPPAKPLGDGFGVAPFDNAGHGSFDAIDEILSSRLFAAIVDFAHRPVHRKWLPLVFTRKGSPEIRY
jgi:hypothetical protein